MLTISLDEGVQIGDVLIVLKNARRGRATLFIEAPRDKRIERLDRKDLAALRLVQTRTVAANSGTGSQ